jgi:predicted RNase H-like HicB family nuclease
MNSQFTVFVKQGENGYWIAQVLEMKNAHAQGKSKDEALENLKEVITMLQEIQAEELEESGFERMGIMAFA